jgi:hypothetical protein
MLISTLLRHFVSAEVASSSININNGEKVVFDHWDSATEWIQLLLAKLAKIGLLPTMYRSINNRKHNTESESPNILPEQNVLLHCMAQEAGSYVMDYRTNNNAIKNPFGGEVGLEALKENYVFLARLVTHFSPILENEPVDSNGAIESSLIRSGLILVTEIIASTLGIDSPENTDLRLFLGKDTTLLQDTAKSLGLVTDVLAEKSVGRKARDIHLSCDDQKLLTCLVQLIGNLCYNCPYNQDLLRMTLVLPTTKTPTTEREIRDGSSSNPNNGPDTTRNGLHVLLTCTTYATSCFTLREWGVIAIRNALENNSRNQAVVTELVAQDPVQSADLENAGIRVKLDSKGKVSLSKIDEENQKKSSER